MATYETTTTITITMLVTTTTATAAEGTRRGGYTEICARRHEISDRAKTSSQERKISFDMSKVLYPAVVTDCSYCF